MRPGAARLFPRTRFRRRMRLVIGSKFISAPPVIRDVRETNIYIYIYTHGRRRRRRLVFLVLVLRPPGRTRHSPSSLVNVSRLSDAKAKTKIKDAADSPVLYCASYT